MSRVDWKVRYHHFKHSVRFPKMIFVFFFPSKKLRGAFVTLEKPTAKGGFKTKMMGLGVEDFPFFFGCQVHGSFSGPPKNKHFEKR